LQFWKTAKDEVLKMTIEQVVSGAGDGTLHDQSPCSIDASLITPVPLSSHRGNTIIYA